MPLLWTWDRFPFYDEVMGGIGHEQQDENERIKVQLSLIASLLSSSDDFFLLQHLRSNVGVFANHQESYADFNWEKTHLLVSTLYIYLV